MNTNFKILNRIRFYQDKTSQISKAVMEVKMYLVSLDQSLAQIELKRTKLDSEYEVRVDGHISNQRQYLENCARQVLWALVCSV